VTVNGQIPKIKTSLYSFKVFEVRWATVCVLLQFLKLFITFNIMEVISYYIMCYRSATFSILRSFVSNNLLNVMNIALSTITPPRLALALTPAGACVNNNTAVPLSHALPSL
jgi:hypothetical protein